MKKLFTKKKGIVLLSVLCAAFFVGAILLLGFKTPSMAELNKNTPTVSPLATFESYDEKYVLKDSSEGTKTEIWNEVIGSDNYGKKVYVVLGEDWCLDGTGQPNTYLSIPTSSHVTLDLAGYTISRNLSAASATGWLIYIDGDFTLTDTVGGGKLTGGWTSNTIRGGCVRVNDGTFTMNGGTITGNKATRAGGGVLVETTGEFIMNGGSISNNAASYNTSGYPGGGLHLEGEATINGGTISDNSSGYGAGIASFGTLTINGGTISGNSASSSTGSGSSGGGIYIGGTNTKVTMNGGSISGNYAAASGGGVYFSTNENGNTFTLNGGDISNNQSGLSKEGVSSSSLNEGTGAGLYVSGTNNKFIMNGGTVSNNKTLVWGGGMIVNSSATAFLLGGTISENSVGAGCSGGGAYLSSCTVYMGAVTVIGNTSPGGGAGVFCESPGNLNFVGGTVITDNTRTGAVTGPSNLWLHTNNTQVKIAITSGTVSGVAYPGFLNDARAAHVGVSFATYPTGTNKLIFTSGYTSSNYWIGEFFYSDDRAYNIDSYGSGNYNGRIAASNSMTEIVLAWKIRLSDDSSTWYDITDPALLTKLGAGASLNSFNNLLTYTYGGVYVTGLKLHHEKTSNGSVYDIDTTDPNIPPYWYSDSFGKTAFTDAKNVGDYSIGVDSAHDPAFMGFWYENSTINISVNKKDVTVNLKDKTVEYGMSSEEYLSAFSDPANGYWEVSPSTPLVSGDSLTGIKLVKSAGTQAGYTYIVSPDNASMSSMLAANPNYNISFSGTAKLSVSQRKVTVILNDDYTTYADSVKIPKGDTVDRINENAFLTKTENTSTKYFDEDGNEKTDENGNAYYKGGWQYGGDSAGTSDEAKLQQFISADMSSGAPFKYTFNYTTASYNANDSDKWLNVGTYSINVSCTNPNYDVTFVNAQDSSKSTITYTIRSAELGSTLKAPSESEPKVPDYTTATYTGTDKAISVPDVALTVKGYQGLIDYTDTTGKSTSSWYLYIVQKQEDGVTPDPMPSEATVAAWTAAGAKSSVSGKEKGSYLVYVLVTVPNHVSKAYSFTYSLGASKIEYKIVLSQKPSASGSAQTISPDSDGAYKTTYNGQAVTAQIVFAWDYDSTVSKPATWDSDKPTVELYYKSTDSYGYGSSDDSPDESVDTAGNPLALGNKTATALAGSYRVSMAVTSANSNYSLSPASGFNSYLDYTISPQELTVPTAPDSVKYDGKEHTFKITLSYASTIAVKIGSLDGSTFSEDLPDGLTEETSSAATEKDYKATNAGKYALAFQLPLDSPDGKSPRNYKWKDSTKAEATVTLEISQVELRVSWKFLSDSEGAALENLGDKKANVTGEISTVYTTNYEPITVDGVKEEVKLQYWYQYIKDAEGNEVTSNKVLVATSDKFLIENLKYGGSHVAGTYLIGVQLLQGEDYTVNDNYKFDADTASYFSKELKITAGDADLGSMTVQFKHNGADYDFSADSTTFEYKTDSSGNVLGYTFGLDFSTLEYMEADTSSFPNGVKYQKKDKNGDWQDVTEIDGAGEYRVVFAVKVKDAEKNDHTLPDNSDFESEIFSGYVRDTADPSKAQFNFNFTVERAEIDLSNVKYEYKSADGTWKEYDPKNPPEYTGLGFTVRLKTPYPAGIVGAEFVLDSSSSTNTNKGPGSFVNDVTFTLDENHKYTEEDGTVKTTEFTISVTIAISPQGIEAQWKTANLTDENGEPITDEFITGMSGVPYQIAVLNVADEYKNYIAYEYILKNSDGTETVFTDIMDFINATQASSQNPKQVTIRAKMSSSAPTIGGVCQYGLKDSTGATVEYVDKVFLLGSTLDLAEVTVLKDSSVYGDSVVYSDMFTVKMANGNNLAATFYTVNVLDGNGKDLGDIADVDFALLDAGTYVITLTLTESASQSYILSRDSFKFTVAQKELEVPELIGSVVFDGTIIDITSYFDSKYQEYVDAGLIQVTGTKEARNAGKEYFITLTLLSANYKWKESEPSVVGLAVWLADEETDSDYTLTIDGQAAAYGWQIKPFVLTSDLWSFGEDGAKINAPDWINSLIASGSLTIGVNYYENENSATAIENPEIKGGATFFVNGVVGGDDAQNFVFENGSVTGERVSYTVPQNMLGQVGQFFTQPWLAGLPMWVWFLIFFVVFLLLLILIIVIAKHRKKKKAEKLVAAEKAEKQQELDRIASEREEEKRRREEEREEEKRRREEEREEEKRRREEEREEEKRRREEEREARIAAMGNNGGNNGGSNGGLGMGANGMTMNVMPVPMNMGMQQPMPQPMQPPMPQPMQQPVAQPIAEPPARAGETISADHLKDEIKNDLKEDFGHKERVERLLETIATSREHDRQKFEQEEQERNERMQSLEARRKERLDAITEFHHAPPFDPSADKIRDLEGKLHSMEELMWMMRFGGMPQMQQPQQPAHPQLASGKDERVLELEMRLREMELKQQEQISSEKDKRVQDLEKELQAMRSQQQEMLRREEEERRFREWEARMDAKLGLAPQAPVAPQPVVTRPAEPVAPVRQPSPQTAPHPTSVQPGSVMTTTTTTTIDATKDAKADDLPDYTTRFIPRRRN